MLKHIKTETPWGKNEFFLSNANIERTLVIFNLSVFASENGFSLPHQESFNVKIVFYVARESYGHLNYI